MNKEQAQRQAEDLPYMKLLAIVMWDCGIEDFSIDADRKRRRRRNDDRR